MSLGMLIGAGVDFCSKTANIWKVVGYVVMVIKIVIPIILVVFGMVDLGKAVIQSDEKAIGKAVSSLIKRFVAAVIIFFVPTIVSGVFGILGVWRADDQKDFEVCLECVTNVSDCDTSGVVGNLSNESN